MFQRDFASSAEPVPHVRIYVGAVRPPLPAPGKIPRPAGPRPAPDIRAGVPVDAVVPALASPPSKIRDLVLEKPLGLEHIAPEHPQRIGIIRGKINGPGRDETTERRLILNGERIERHVVYFLEIAENPELPAEFIRALRRKPRYKIDGKASAPARFQKRESANRRLPHTSPMHAPQRAVVEALNPERNPVDAAFRARGNEIAPDALRIHLHRDLAAGRKGSRRAYPLKKARKLHRGKEARSSAADIYRAPRGDAEPGRAVHYFGAHGVYVVVAHRAARHAEKIAVVAFFPAERYVDVK